MLAANVKRPRRTAIVCNAIHPLLAIVVESGGGEQVKRFTLLSEPFSMERGELTNTLKLKRSVVAKNYKELIDKMYEE